MKSKTKPTVEGTKPNAHPPLFNTYEEASAYSNQVGDSYYALAFLLETWISNLITDAIEKYADQVPHKRRLQTGEAVEHSLIKKLFKESTDGRELAIFMQNLRRFGEQGYTSSHIILNSLGLFGIENDFSPVIDVEKGFSVESLRALITRICEWLDSQIHWQTHFGYYRSPGSFFPGDEEARFLFGIGHTERFLPELSAHDLEISRSKKACALASLTNPGKWKFFLDGVKKEATRCQTHPKVDDCVIGLWPLVKRFNWSYNELLTVLEHALPNCAGIYPCDYYVNLQKHCRQTLGLKKGTGEQRGLAGKKTERDENTPLPEGFNVVKAFLAKRDAVRREVQGK